MVKTGVVKLSRLELQVTTRVKQGLLLIGLLLASASCTQTNTRSEPAQRAQVNPKPDFNHSDTAQVLAPGRISTGSETSSTITADAHTILFTRHSNNGRTAVIMRSTWTGTEWSTPSRLNLGTGDREMDPKVSPDGKTLYFVAPRRRDAATGDQDGDLDMWMTTLAEQPVDGSTPGVATLGAYQLVSARITTLANSADDESNPSIARDGTLFFAHRARALRVNPEARNGGASADAARSGSEIMYFSKRIRTTPVPVVLDKRYTQPLTPFISYDGRALIFSAVSTDSRSGRDLFVSVRREDGRWSEPRDLGREVNSRANEFAPQLSPTLDYLFFTRAENAEEATSDYTGAGNIMVIPISSIPVLRDALQKQ